MSDTQNRATLRRKTEVAFAHKRLANEILDSIADTQAKFNSAMDKLNADTAGALDTNYAATESITDLFEADDEKAGAQHKATLRKSLRSALAHKKLADEIADAMEEMQAAHNAAMAKLDAQAGTLTDTNFAALLGLDVIDADAEGDEAQHKASFRKSLRSAMANRRAADQIMDAITSMQSSFNDSMAALDAGSVAGAHAGFKVDVLDPDAE